ncbi:MAG: Protein GrpE [Candidatus Moranbacteria bacterium GW2011_GWF2_36_839]|nr:MAG: Protein GrpE [Candidatus Moranbacteria bacterium GW2011_GWF1_36_78]KKQ16325.1 MAG: Protein GrpE [Candidatus Moranbacteria bacterium GW2011_GWF2_36_839]HAT74202.1 nucleotide exchange factor GrpE [Candidatus Moranbacteria bacterium]HBY10615.1 nucleotide exchange factor GrpE [Candidatus Moranbacteria bacterium]
MEKTKKDFFSLTVKAVIINQEGKVLIIKRSENDSIKAGEYDLPGGNVDYRENIEIAIKREIEEELGIKVEIGPIIYAFDFENKYDREYEFGKEKIKVGGKGLRFIAYYKEGEIKLSDEHQAYEWLDFDKALEKFGDSDFTKDKKESIVKTKEYLELKNSLEGWKRCMADFENYKKRQNEERKDIIAFSNVNLISELIPILDNFHASTEHIPEDQKDGGWVVGIMHIQKQLEKVLEENGVSEILVNVGDEFDPNIMESITDANLRTECESTNGNKVKKVLMKGYKINNKVIRVARVVIK